MAARMHCKSLQHRAFNGHSSNRSQKPTALRAVEASTNSKSLDQALQRLPGMQAVLPGNQQVKQQIMQIIQQMESHNLLPQPLQAATSSGSSGSALHPATQLLGNWQLVFASNGTVVTRTRFARLLASLAELPGFGLSSIQQSLSIDPDTPAGCISSTNQAVFGLGPLGSWRVTIRGTWSAAGPDQPPTAAAVQFDEFAFKLVGFLGAQLPEQLPEVRIRLPRAAREQQRKQAVPQSSSSSSSSLYAAGTENTPAAAAAAPSLRPAALWLTTYLDDSLRVGRGGSSGNVFLFRKCVQQQQH